MNKTLDYYKNSTDCPKCGWIGPWHIFRYPSQEPDNYEGDVLYGSGDWNGKCPKCKCPCSGALTDFFYGGDSPYVLYIWDECL